MKKEITQYINIMKMVGTKFLLSEKRIINIERKKTRVSPLVMD